MGYLVDKVRNIPVAQPSARDDFTLLMHCIGASNFTMAASCRAHCEGVQHHSLID